MRLFVSIDMPKEVCEVVAEVQHYLKRRNLFEGTYADAAHAHLTVAFLGDVDQEAAKKIEAALCTIEPPSYPARLGSLGHFERGDHVKVIFVNLVCPKLVGFVERVHAVLSEWYEPGSRPFHSHITLARVKHSSDHEKLRQELVSYAVPKIEFTIDGFALKESVLQSDGPVHTVRASYPEVK